jgi:hypothetical protein
MSIRSADRLQGPPRRSGTCCTADMNRSKGRTNTGSVYLSVCDLTAQKMPLSASTCQHDMRHCMSSLLLHCHVGEFQHLARLTRSCMRPSHSLLLCTTLPAHHTADDPTSSVQDSEDNRTVPYARRPWQIWEGDATLAMLHIPVPGTPPVAGLARWSCHPVRTLSKPTSNVQGVRSRHHLSHGCAARSHKSLWDVMVPPYPSAGHRPD